MVKNTLNHFKLITKHKILVFKLCVKAGVPLRGFMHDFSKYSKTEFFESVKYFSGVHSPIEEAKKDKGYSEVWLHHKSRNKHHFYYWYDHSAFIKSPIMPYKYVVEMLCDDIAASMIYKKDKYTDSSAYDYFINRNKTCINEKICKIMEDVFNNLKNEGLDKTINKKYLKATYNKYVKKEEQYFINFNNIDFKMVKKMIKYFIFITKEKIVFFNLAFKSGILIRGLFHDISKYSFDEFMENVKYFDGINDPIELAKKDKGYSTAWLHHRGRNKYNYHYWYDQTASIKSSIMPYKYFVEMVCDDIKKCIIYEKNNYNDNSVYNYFINNSYNNLNITNLNMLEETYNNIKKEGLNRSINKKKLKEIYNYHLNNYHSYK